MRRVARALCEGASSHRRWLPLLSPVMLPRAAAAANPCRHLSSAKKVKKVTVYTRTGDKGTSSLYSGTRRPKSDPLFHALGSTDTLNAQIGMAREHLAALGDEGARRGWPPRESSGVTTCPRSKLLQQLELVQCTLIDLGAAVATPPSCSTTEALERVSFDGLGHAKRLESWIDEHELSLPPLRTFVLPGGGICASQLHVARVACRETERVFVELAEELDGGTLAFVNRLSDYLFVASRVAAALPPPHGGIERPYAPCQLE